jgi:thymidylate synthase (FAD)
MDINAEPVLDHGYVRYIPEGKWGSDEQIVESARMSTQKGFKGWGTPDAPGDEKLLAYLWDHRHSTPFEFAGATFEICAPLLVFREWHRHRTQWYSEASARYGPLPDMNYRPTRERIIAGAKAAADNRQAQGTAPLNEPFVDVWLANLEQFYDKAEAMYQDALTGGIPKEVARVVLPVGRYSKMRAGANLRNWLHFLDLRQHPTAQWEIRQYADAVHEFLVREFPRTMALVRDAA